MPEVEYVTVANHAEALNGLLYLSGAGWTEANVARQPDGNLQIFSFGIGLSVLIGWNETNQRFPLSVTVTGEDGGQPLVHLDAQVEQGRPPGLRPGQDLRSVLAVNCQIQFPGPGGYQVLADVGGRKRSVSFTVHSPAQPPLPSGPAFPRPPFGAPGT